MKSKLKFSHYQKRLVDCKNFKAGHQELQKYIQELMPQHEKRGLARHYIGLDDNGNFVSLVCLCTSVIVKKQHMEPDKNLPENMDRPTIKIGRLVVDKGYRGKGYGEQTLEEAIRIFVEVSKKIGVIGLTVDAKKGVEGFYKKYGFIEFGAQKNANLTPLILFTLTLKKKRPNLFQ